jgi:predicted amidohydrolase
VISTDFGSIGLAICYDLRFPALFMRLSEGGAEIIIVPAAWPGGRIEQWSVLVRGRALENQCFLVGCNGVGVQGDTRVGGRSLVVTPTGETLAHGDDDQPGEIGAALSLAELRELRREFPVLADRRTDLGTQLVGKWG